MTELLFKVLGPNGQPHHGGKGEWPLPRNGKPGKWLKVEGKLVPCKNGLHLCRPLEILKWAGPTLWLAEAGKERIDDGNKLVVRRARLLSQVETWNDKTLRLFAADCAERALERERKAGREPDKRSCDAVRIGRDYARGKASDSERAAAWDAAWDAVRVAARDAAWDAARVAAVDAARAAASAAARTARAAASAAARTARAAARAAAGNAADAAEREWQTRSLLRHLKVEAA